MARKTDPRDELDRLKKTETNLKEEIKAAEKRLHIRLGKLVCDAGADAFSDEELQKILVDAVAGKSNAARSASGSLGTRSPV